MRLFTPIILLVFTFLPTFARALSFSEAIALAKQNDPAYKSAQANLNAVTARSDFAFSNLLPHVSASASKSKNNRDYTTESHPPFTTNERFNSDSYQVTLTQPLWEHSHIIEAKQANLMVNQAKLQLANAEQDIFVRLTQAWFDLMQARDTSLFTHRQTITAQSVLEQTQRSDMLGLTATPALEEMQAKFAQALADAAAAKADENIKLAALASIIGTNVDVTPPQLSERYNYSPHPDETPDNCINYAISHTPSILAALKGQEAANAEIDKQRAGHEPTLDLVASYTNNAQGAGTTPEQLGYQYNQKAIELRLTVPIYSGGGQNAKVREAIAMREKATYDLENAQYTAQQVCKQAWYSRQSSNARVAATLQTIKFLTTTYESVRSANIKGLKTETDIRQADQQLQQAIRDLQKARYESLLNTFKLRAVMGKLTENDLTELDSYFESFPQLPL